VVASLSLRVAGSAAGHDVGADLVRGGEDDRGAVAYCPNPGIRTVKLNFAKPILSVPENLYNYPTAILHRDARRT
jgi:hypothetical protein